MSKRYGPKIRPRLERFIHPAVRACINPETKAYFDFTGGWSAEDRTRSGAISRHETGAFKNGAAAAFLPADGFTTPVRPACDLSSRSISIVVNAAPLSGGVEGSVV